MKRVLQILLAAVGCWSGCSKSAVLTPRQFTREFAEALRASTPAVKVSIMRELELKVTAPDGHEFTSYLANAYDMYKQDPKAKVEVIQKFVAAVLETSNEIEESVDRKRIIPVIKDRAWLEETRQAMRSRGVKEIPENVYEDFNSELVIVYAQDSPKNIRYLTPKDLVEARIERADLKALACENLKQILPKIERRGGNGLYMVTAGGDYEASLLLLDSIWVDGEMQLHGDIIVAIPTRDLLLVTGSQHPQGIQKLQEMIAKAFNENYSYRLTQKLFVYRNGKFSEFDAGAEPAAVLNTNAPVVKVDGNHQMINYPAGSDPEQYRIRASMGMILDATDYTFDVPLEVRDKPLNSIQVVLGRTRKYELAWRQGTTRYELSKTTLKPLQGVEPFDGFKAGDKVSLAIGVIFAPGKFAPVWMSIIDVE